MTERVSRIAKRSMVNEETNRGTLSDNLIEILVIYREYPADVVKAESSV